MPSAALRYFQKITAYSRETLRKDAQNIFFKMGHPVTWIAKELAHISEWVAEWKTSVLDRPTLLAFTLRSRISPCYRVSKVKVPKGMKSLPTLWVNIILSGLLSFFRQTACFRFFLCYRSRKNNCKANISCASVSLKMPKLGLQTTYN